MRSASGLTLLPRVVALSCVLAAALFGEHLPVKIFNSADGLGSSFVDYMASDSRGFMWFCTRDGLSRFDGSQFVTYHIQGNNSPPGFEDIYEAHDGTYWITSVGGVYRFDPNTLSAPDEKTPTLDAERITGWRGPMYEDRQGNFWLGSAGLYRIEMHDGKAAVLPFDLGLPPKPNVTFAVADITESSEGSLWIDSTWGLIRRLPNGRIVFYPDNGPGEVQTGAMRIAIDKSDRVWMVNGNLLYVIKPDGLDSLTGSEQVVSRPITPTRMVDLVPNGKVDLPENGGEVFQYKNPEYIDKWFGKQLFKSSDGTMWVAAEENLLEFVGGVMRVHSTAEGLPNVMARIGEDSVGNLWIGSQSGLARLDRRGLITFGRADGASADRFIGITEGSDGTMYFANPNAHIDRFTGDSFESVRPGIEPNALHLWTRTLI